MKNKVQITSFRKKVYEAVSLVPRGKVTSYGQIAKSIGCRSSQAIGQALKVNPFSPQVPCHRVICQNGYLGGFCGKRSGKKMQDKLKLLASEGVFFDDQGFLLDHSRMVQL